MCGSCEGEPNRGVKALFNADLQMVADFEDRGDWRIISNKVIVYLGASAFKNEDRPLFHGCEIAVRELTDDERAQLEALSAELSRPLTSRPRSS